ncbi:MAG: hypothetical protein VB041_01315, partial [Candidatus Limiplasma sp.]|nr:hypothetical protein [Candidatus Limiplasma sp.]
RPHGVQRTACGLAVAHGAGYLCTEHATPSPPVRRSQQRRRRLDGCWLPAKPVRLFSAKGACAQQCSRSHSGLPQVGT